MNMILIILVTFFAGMGAGLGTGFAGMSAAAVISPMLITFLGIDPYMVWQWELPCHQMSWRVRFLHILIRKIRTLM